MALQDILVIVSVVMATAVPETMLAAHVTGRCGQLTKKFPCISTKTFATPKPGPGEVLIKVAASSVNPCDVDQVEVGQGCLINSQGIPGSDIAGEVAALGDSCTRLKVGDKVWTDILDHGGAIAEYAVAPEVRVGLAPLSLPLEDAGTIPLVGATSLQCLQQAGAPWKTANLSVVVTSGSGGTGFMGVQLAKALGAARVITATSTANIEFVKSLGADLVVDYTKQNLFDALPDNSIDIVFDNFGSRGTADKAMPKIRKGGLFGVLMGGNGGKISDHPKAGVRQMQFQNIDASNHSSLDTLKQLFEAGKIHAHTQQAFPLDKTSEAYSTSVAGHVNGKLAITITHPYGTALIV